MIGRLLCRLGLHKWGPQRDLMVIGQIYTDTCVRCPCQRTYEFWMERS